MEHFNFTLKEFRVLFPTGYQQGACKIAGISYEKGFLTYHSFGKEISVKIAEESKVYRVNSKGFLIDWTEWDEEFAINKADELKMPNLLTDKHWKVVHSLREHYNKTQTIPNIYELCEKVNITLDDLKDLFPDGFHRGAVKISGLRMK
jgi:tRNA 2-thiouridine synthesizing protein E